MTVAYKSSSGAYYSGILQDLPRPPIDDGFSTNRLQYTVAVSKESPLTSWKDGNCKCPAPRLERCEESFQASWAPQLTDGMAQLIGTGSLAF